jgi:hypothetical protein
MITLLNKILAIFQLKLVSTKPVNLVEESVKFLNTVPESYLCDDIFFPPYVGDVVYVRDKTGKSYFRQQVLGMDDKYYDYGGDTYTLEEIQEKQTIRCGKNGK